MGNIESYKNNKQKIDKNMYRTLNKISYRFHAGDLTKQYVFVFRIWGRGVKPWNWVWCYILNPHLAVLAFLYPQVDLKDYFDQSLI